MTYDFDVIDSSIDKIIIDYDKIIIFVDGETGKQGKIECTEVFGITNLSMWDDTHISNVKIDKLEKFENTDFLKQISKAYDDYPYKPINTNSCDLAITLSNDITFHIYCCDINITECMGMKNDTKR